MKFTFVGSGKKSVSTELAKYFPDMFLVLGDIVGIDENVVQIHDDTNIEHVGENVVHKSLEGCWCISKPFRHYQPFERAISGSKSHLPFFSSGESDEMICMLEIDFGVYSCFAWGV